MNIDNVITINKQIFKKETKIKNVDDHFRKRLQKI